MIVYVKGTRINDDTLRVESEHYFPFDEKHGFKMSEDELLADGGYLVELTPKPVDIIGKRVVTYISLSTLTMHHAYEQVNLPLSQEEEVKQLKENQALMQQALDDLIFGGAL